MSRTVIQLNCSNPQDSETVIQKILSAHDYKRKEKNGEIFYQNGVGFLVAPKFIKYTFNGEVLTLEGWVKPFAFAGESELSGVIGALPKKSCKKVMDEIQANINASIVDNPDFELAIGDENSATHIIAFIVGIIVTLLIPLLGIIIGIYLVTRNNKRAKILGAINIVIALLVWILSLMLIFS